MLTAMMIKKNYNPNPNLKPLPTKNSNNNNVSVILSETTTPLQRLQQKLKSEKQALSAKRHNQRVTNLSAMWLASKL